MLLEKERPKDGNVVALKPIVPSRMEKLKFPMIDEVEELEICMFPDNGISYIKRFDIPKLA